MSANNFFHDHVREALEVDGWTITDDPFVVRVGKKSLPIDLAAERLIAAKKDTEKIAVEITSFRSSSKINEFHTALELSTQPERCRTPRAVSGLAELRK